MAQYKTPGVYVEEKNSFGSSIILNETAVPVFIGFTEVAIYPSGQEVPNIKDSENVKEPVLVRSMLEYQQTFGGADTTGSIAVTKSIDETTRAVTYAAENMNTDGTAPYVPGLIYPAVSNFFSNGGGSCYIVSIGTYEDFTLLGTAAVDLAFIKKSIELAEQATLILPTDLIRYGYADYYTWGTDLTNYSEIEKKYFCVLDVIQSGPNDPVYNEKDISDYRENVSPEFPSYAGAYFPYLKSLTAYAYKPTMSNVTLDGYPLLQGAPGNYSFEGKLPNSAVPDTNIFTFTYKSDEKAPYVPSIVDGAVGVDGVKSIVVNENTLTIVFDNAANTDKNTADSLNQYWDTIKAKHPQWTLTFENNLIKAADTLIKTNQIGVWKTTVPPLDTAGKPFPFIVTCYQVEVANSEGQKPIPSLNVKIGDINPVTTTVVGPTDELITITVPASSTPETALNSTNYPTDNQNPNIQLQPNPLFLEVIVAGATAAMPVTTTDNSTIEGVKTFLSTNYINMPPSPFMAGIYSRLDNASGVWTPPANVAPAGVRGPLVPLTNKQQEDLNVSSTGKSINAIRSFTGKGTLVWGARTNDGNSLDWRYVNVRRLFIAMETDISKSLEAFVFKPNVHNTWVEVKTMIDSYLFGLFNEGAFAGQTPETSYQVLIGVGETMTEEDVLNGYMRASIQVAPVRPAEFIVLTFSQMIGGL